MMRLSGVALTVTLLCSMTAHAAGPFGLEMGMSEQALKTLTPFERTRIPGLLETKTLPEGHPSFALYSLGTTPQTGLCRIVASTKPVSDQFGTELKKEFNGLAKSLAKKYGTPSQAVDSLDDHATWRRPREWLMALRKNERVLKDTWSIEKANLPNNIQRIALQAEALSQTSGQITLTYEFTNSEACAARSVALGEQAL